MQESRYIAVLNAAKELGVSRSSMYYYLSEMKVETHKFPLDKKTYILREDLERIRAAKRAATEQNH